MNHRMQLAAYLVVGGALLAIGLLPSVLEQASGIFVGVGAVLLVLGMVHLLAPRWWREQCNEEARQPAHRRYMRDSAPALALYVVTLLVSVWLIRRGIDDVALRAVVALLPMLGAGLFLRAVLRYLRDIDEFQRKIETQAIGFAALIVPMLYFGGGFLQLAKVIDIRAGVAMIWVFPLMSAMYGIGKMLALRHYR